MSAEPITLRARVVHQLRRNWPFLLLVLAIAIWALRPPASAGLADGAPAPALRAPWTEAGAFDLEAERGHVVVLVFWATWCGACRGEAPTLARVHARIAPRGDRVVGASVDRGQLPAIADAARRLGMHYPIVLASQADSDRFLVNMLPTIYVIGADGRIAASYVGGVGESTLVEAVEAAR